MVAQLIFESQTACYARQRAAALRKLGRCSCVTNPEIMCAFIYGLNDADERVRATAADEIGDQVRKHGGCCCSAEVVAALTVALGDCDRRAVRQVEQALRLCGYDVVSCCKNGKTYSTCSATGSTGCAPANCGPAAAPATIPAATPAVAPVPPASTSVPRKGSLSQLLGYLN